LLKAFRSSKESKVIYVYYYSRFEASPLYPLKRGVRFIEYAALSRSERVFIKTTNLLFIETDLEKVLKDLKLDRLIVAGLTTAHCVAMTIRAAAELWVVNYSYSCPVNNSGDFLGGKIILLRDATATYNASYNGKNYNAETIYGVYLATLKEEFCNIGTTEAVIQSLSGIAL
jgi:nicotinamidase-related amidase